MRKQASPVVLQKILNYLRQKKRALTTGATNVVRSTVNANPRAAEAARGLVGELYNVWQPRSRELLKNLITDRIRAAKESNFAQQLNPRYKGYFDKIVGGEGRFYADKLDRGLNKFNKKIYKKVNRMLTPEEMSMGAQKQACILGFLKRAEDYGINEHQALYLLKQSDWWDKLNTGLNKTTDFVNNKIVDPAKTFVKRQMGPGPFDPANKANFDAAAKNNYAAQMGNK